MKHTVEVVKLNNGARGLLIDVPDSVVIDYDFIFNAGYLFTNFRKYETPHLLEHLMGANTKYPDKNQFKAVVEKNGAYSNAHTNHYHVSYEAECAEFDWQRILELLSLQINDPVFNDSEIPTEKGNIREELSRNLSEPQALVTRNLFFRVHGLPSEEERMKGLADIDKEDVLTHYKDTHLSSNMRFIVSGKLGDKRSKLISLLEENFSQLKKGEYRELPATPNKHLKHPLLIEQDIKQLYYRLGFYHPKPLLERKQLESALLAKSMLTDGYRSRVLSKVRKQGLAYALGSGIQRDVHESTYLLAGFVTPDNAEEVLKIFRSEITAIKNGKFSKTDLEEAKTFRKGRFARSFQTTASLANWYSEYFDFNTYTNLGDYEAIVDSISKEDVVETFGTILDQGEMYSSFVGPVSQQEVEKLHGVMARVKAA